MTDFENDFEMEILELWDKWDILHIVCNKRYRLVRDLSLKEGEDWNDEKCKKEYDKILDQMVVDPSQLDRQEFIIVDGPPFPNGNMHCGHAAVSINKSIVKNFMRMCGYACDNKLGFDCHGIPIETKACQSLGINPRDMMNFGLEKVSDKCRALINMYSDPSHPSSWKHFMRRLGRWESFSPTRVYKTMDLPYMESVMAIFHRMYQKGLVYTGYNVLPYSCEYKTVLSNSEIEYKRVSTESVYVAFPSATEADTFYIAWTTTPWTLPSNMALCVNPESVYMKVSFFNYTQKKQMYYYISPKRATIVLPGCIVVGRALGSELAGNKYYPPFTVMSKMSSSSTKIFTVISDPYVRDTDESGTGIVHLSAPFGEDDFNVCQKHGIVSRETLNKYCTINDNGEFNKLVPNYEGRSVFDPDVNRMIIDDLVGMNLHVKSETITHDYPHDERAKKPIIYKPVESVFIRVTDLKEKMLQMNKKVNWVPEHVGRARFHNWLSNAHDWTVSRNNRVFGTPIPLWIGDKGTHLCIGSIAELCRYSGKDPSTIKDLHKDNLKKIVFLYGGELFRLCDFTFDCWFESGCAPLAQHNYPFENVEMVERQETDFISEGLDQTRGWFYTLMVIHAALFDEKKLPFKNVMCSGLVLDKTGHKISKRLGNDIDLRGLFSRYGSDLLRVYMAKSPLGVSEPLKFDTNEIEIIERNRFRLVNAQRYFIDHVTNYIKNGGIFEPISQFVSEDTYGTLTNAYDRWILHRLDCLARNVKQFLSEYKLNRATQETQDFIEDLVNKYIKYNRPRLSGNESAGEWSKSLSVLQYVLHTYARVRSPITPFMSEHIHQYIWKPYVRYINLSIHQMLYPRVFHPTSEYVDENIERCVGYMEKVCDGVRILRSKSKSHTSIRVAIKKCVIFHQDKDVLKSIEDNINTISSSTNCVEYGFELMKDNIAYSIAPNFRVLSKVFGKDTQEAGKTIRSLQDEQVLDVIKSIDEGKDIIITIGDVSTTISPDCLVIKSFPKPTDITLTTVPIDDLMIGVDFMIDDNIMEDHWVKCVKSVIQQERKALCLKPWDKIYVHVDRIGEAFKIVDPKAQLEEALMNCEVTMHARDGRTATLTVTLNHTTENIVVNVSVDPPTSLSESGDTEILEDIKISEQKKDE